MSITLGNQPDSLQVVLTRDADFVSTLTNSDGDWSPTCTIELRIGDDTVWPATIVDNVASFDVDKVAVNDLLEDGATKVRLFYTDGAADLCWAKGSVRRA
ncbi:hypothetical protein [Aeromicrobium sp. 9AM]|uniref:LtfC-like domain-containing protein n=1 Tax=Aeromicrobium sp. 9AM TaxID=2653126 RepID=UPI0012F45DFE|nr:hypothetical protein [Aeromicrobium sp. 9AM]VXC09174.1 conserved hypothetical protein [Aeromicrobium sp. 9AM]